MKVIYVSEFGLNSSFHIMETVLKASFAYICLDDAVYITGCRSSVLVPSWHL
jgi:hypothetical protein